MTLTHADRERIRVLCQDTWDHVFTLLDSEIGLPTDDAGKAATEAERAVRAVLEAAWGISDREEVTA